MNMLKVTGNNDMQKVFLKGDKANPEPAEFYINFPGGSIGVARCSDGSYWVHINAEENKEDYSERIISDIVAARIDCKDLHANEMQIGDLARNDCYHIAVKIRKPI